VLKLKKIIPAQKVNIPHINRFTSVEGPLYVLNKRLFGPLWPVWKFS